MKLRKIYELVVQEGMKADPRGEAKVENNLKKLKSHYQSLSQKEKEFFDKERLNNPYGDTRILFGAPDIEIRTALVGIDIDTSELLLIDRLNADRKNKIDMAISHHPQGSAFAGFYEVMDMQADIFHSVGVPINISEQLVEERKREVARKIHAANHLRAADAAGLLGIPFMCAHTPADNHVGGFLQKMMDQNKPETLGEIMDLLEKIEEYRIAKSNHAGPCILFGKRENRAGKIFVDMTGGTEGPKEIIDNLLAAGVGTLIGMHLSEEHYKKCQGKNINVIIAGHISSDNLGLNLLLDKIQKASKIKILACSGFRRVTR